MALTRTLKQQQQSQLSLNGREKRGRLFVERGSNASVTLKGLKQEVRM